MVAANKSDISGVSPGEYAKGVIEQVEALMPDVRAPPVLSVCALDGEYLRRVVSVLGGVGFRRVLRVTKRQKSRAYIAFSACSGVIGMSVFLRD